MTDTVTRLTTALADRYRIERELGQGGMATVYLAQDLKHDRQVAIKVLRQELAAVIGAERFLSEIKTTANLQHPHILPLHDSGEADGFLFYVMPLVEGESLRDRLDAEKQLPISDAVQIAVEVASALDYAHRHGVIHRDIKPENILLHDGRAVVADFGIALAVSTAGSTRMTETGMSLGTPHYMSPEQAMGEREITARSDVYALACVLYEMLVGEPPFTGPTAQAIIARAVTETPRSLRIQRHTVPEHVEAAVVQALEKLPADRFATAAEFMTALKDRKATMRTTAAVGAGGAPAARGGKSALLPWALLGFAAIVIGWLGISRLQGGASAPGDVVRAILELPEGAELGYPTLSLSREGNRIVVAGYQNGNRVLLQRPLDELEFSVVPGSEGGNRQFLSPDGDWVAFSAGSELRKVPLEGGQAVRITESRWAGGDWTEDGTIVYSPSYVSGLWSVPAGGGTPKQLSTPDTTAAELAHWWPQVLPDGEHILFTAFRTPVDRARIEVLSLKTGERKLVIEGGVSGRYVATGHLLYARNESLFAVPFDLGRLEVTGQPVPVLSDLAMDTQDGRAGFSVSDNGTLAYVSAAKYSTNLELVWVDRSGQVSSPITESGRYGQPRISPDGRRVALAVSRPGEPQDVWILDLARGTRTPLTSGGGGDFGPLFTLDGTRVIYQSERPVFDLYLRPIDVSSPAVPLLVSPFDKAPGSITPDGAMLLFENLVLPHSQLWTISMGGDGEVTFLLGSESGSLGQPILSPSGQWLAYVSDESGRNEVYLTRYPNVTSGRRLVSASGGTDP
ncbi:MAG: protein kinase, partial [Gemmatimonadota bacterium]|nr:protein kinase [Gemmatimonadota bacterium]